MYGGLSNGRGLYAGCKTTALGDPRGTLMTGNTKAMTGGGGEGGGGVQNYLYK